MEMRRAICIFIFIQLFPPPHLIPLWPLSVAGGLMCVMSTESNGKLLKVFSQSFVFAKLLFVDHRIAEQLWPTAGCQVELVNCPLIQITSR